MTKKEKMTEKEKIREYLIGMANAACCNKQTAKDIKEIIIPHIDSMQEEPVSDDLEKAAINYMKTENPPIWGLHDGFIVGANWQKQQMMAKAVEITFNVSLLQDVYEKLWIKGCKKGDKLLIIKED